MCTISSYFISYIDGPLGKVILSNIQSALFLHQHVGLYAVQEGSRCKGIQGGTSKEEIKCVCLNARSIINKKNELNIMVDDIKPHIIGITESWATMI